MLNITQNWLDLLTSELQRRIDQPGLSLTATHEKGAD